MRALLGIHHKPDFFAKRICGFFDDGSLDATTYGRVDFARSVRDCCEPVIAGCHPKTGGEFGPSLMKVGSATAEVGLETEQVGLGSIIGPVPLKKRAEHLVGLLIVLVRP